MHKYIIKFNKKTKELDCSRDKTISIYNFITEGKSELDCYKLLVNDLLNRMTYLEDELNLLKHKRNKIKEYLFED